MDSFFLFASLRLCGIILIALSSLVLICTRLYVYPSHGGGYITENQIAAIVVDRSLKIHRALGPGLLESVSEVTLAYELTRRGLRVLTQQRVPVIYEDVKLDLGFPPDIIIDSKVIVEVKSIEAIAPVHRKQLETYLRLTGIRLGLLINFNVELIKHGIQRVVNQLPE